MRSTALAGCPPSRAGRRGLGRCSQATRRRAATARRGSSPARRCERGSICVPRTRASTWPHRLPHECGPVTRAPRCRRAQDHRDQLSTNLEGGPQLQAPDESRPPKRSGRAPRSGGEGSGPTPEDWCRGDVFVTPRDRSSCAALNTASQAGKIVSMRRMPPAAIHADLLPSRTWRMAQTTVPTNTTNGNTITVNCVPRWIAKHSSEPRHPTDIPKPSPPTPATRMARTPAMPSSTIAMPRSSRRVGFEAGSVGPGAAGSLEGGSRSGGGLVTVSLACRRPYTADSLPARVPHRDARPVGMLRRP